MYTIDGMNESHSLYIMLSVIGHSNHMVPAAAGALISHQSVTHSRRKSYDVHLEQRIGQAGTGYEGEIINWHINPQFVKKVINYIF